MNTKQVAPEKYSRLLEDCEAQCKGKYCFYRKYMESQHPSIFIVLQVKMIEKMKWIWSKEKEMEISWKEASDKWVADKLADAYREAYEAIPEDNAEDIEIIFKRTMEEHKKIVDKSKA